MRVDILDPISFETTAEAVKAIATKLRTFEKTYKQDSSEFYRSYKQNPRKADLSLLEWASTYELLLSYMTRMTRPDEFSLPNAFIEGASSEAPSFWALAA